MNFNWLKVYINYLHLFSIADTINDTHSLSSGRGSVLYSSSSSLSSGGSNGSNSNGSSNAMSSPVGAGVSSKNQLHTIMMMKEIEC